MYNLDEVQAVCRELGLACDRLSPDEARIHLAENRLLSFANEADGDTIAGFLETPWHFHGNLMLMTGPDTYLELNPPDLLMSLCLGETLLFERHVSGAHQDSWLAHHLERPELRYLEAEEELRIRCLKRI